MKATYDPPTRQFFTDRPVGVSELQRHTKTGYAVPEIAWPWLQRAGATFITPPKQTDLDRGSVYTDAGIPLDFQWAGICFLAGRTAAVLADDMGLGKTAQAIWAATCLLVPGEIQRVLVVCPKAVIENWQSEIARFAPRWAHKFSIVHYEGLPKIKAMTPATLLIVDEVHNLASEQSNRAFFLWRLRLHAVRCWGLTGTPVRNRPKSVYMLYKIVTGAEVTQKQWEYVFWDAHRRDYKNLPQMQALVSSICLRRLKEEVTDLPPKVKIPIYVDLTGEQKTFYESLKKDLVTWVKDSAGWLLDLRSHEALTRLNRCLAATTWPGLLGQDIEFESVAKFKAMRHIIEDVVDSQKIIIWSQHPKVLDEVAAHFAELQPAVAHGERTRTQSMADIQRFKDDPSCRILCASIKAFGEGINLQVASVGIWLDTSWEYDKFTQSLDRIHRLGQLKQCTFYFLLARGTMDEYRWRVLENKHLYQQLLTGKLDARTIILPPKK